MMRNMQKSPGNTKWTKKRMVLVVLLVVVLGLGTYSGALLVIQQRQANRQFALDKVRYAQTEKDMAAAYAAVVKAIGQPYEMNSGKGCSYGNLKYARGPLGCGIVYAISYSIPNYSASKTVGDTARSVIDNHFGFTPGTNTYGLGDINQESGQYSDYLESVNKLGCTLSHETYTKDEYNSFGKPGINFQKDATTAMTTVSMICEKNVSKALYPISKSPG